MGQIPNLITAVRVLLTPWIVLDVLRGDCSRALLVTLIAGSTDFIDGVAARHFSSTSRAGAYLDPIADKLLLTSVYLCFSIANLAPDWLVWLIVGRDVLILTMVAFGLAFTEVRDYPPSIWGKASTVLQIGTVLVILARCAYAAEVPVSFASAAIWATAVATCCSGAHYAWRAVQTIAHGPMRWRQ